MGAACTISSSRGRLLAPLRMIPFGLLAIPILLHSSLLCAQPEDGFIDVRIEAKAPGTGMDARLAATRTAQDEIIEQVLKTALAVDDPSVVKTILDKKDIYLRSTQLLRYDTVENETRVEVQCSVNRNQILRDAAAIMLPRMPAQPKVMVLVAEQVAPDKPATASEAGTAEREIAKALRKASFEVVDNASVRASHAGPELLQAIQGDLEAAGAFARKGFAEAVVLGQAVAMPKSPGSSQAVPKISGKVTLRVFRARDGKCIDTITQEAAVHSADPVEGAAAALEDACAKLNEDVVVLCFMAVVGEHPRDELVITLEEPGTRARFDAFTKTLADATDPQTLEVLFYSDHLARVRVRYAGAMVPLMDTLTGKTYDNWGLETRRALERDVTLHFVER